MDYRDTLTLVAPTRDRHPYLARFMEYYADAPFQVWVVDGSQEYYSGEIPASIRYIHTPGIPYCKKLAQVFPDVTTPYSVLGAEDDFFMSETLLEALTFMQEHPDYGSVQGQWAGYRPGTQPLDVSMLHGRGNQFHADQEDVFTRMETLYIQYTPIYYAVQRTPFFQDFFAATAPKVFNLNLVEMLLGLYNMIEGKSWVMPAFYGAREYIATSAGNKRPMIFCAYTESEAEEYRRVIQLAAERWHALHGLPIEKAQIKVKQALHLYYALVNDPTSKKIKASRPRWERLKFYLTYRKYKARYVPRYQGKKGFPFTKEAELEAWQSMLRLIEKHDIKP